MITQQVLSKLFRNLIQRTDLFPRQPHKLNLYMQPHLLKDRPRLRKPSEPQGENEEAPPPVLPPEE